MKKLLPLCFIAAMAMFIAGCESKKNENTTDSTDTVAVNIPDSAIYGIVGEGSTMHTLELITEDGKTMSIAVNQDSCSDVQGGIFAGDKVTLITRPGSDDTPEVVKLVNITSLLGKWTSLDRNFEIQEDGVIASNITTESHPLTHWDMANANLILNADTFSVLLLGPDSLSIENNDGIYVYKRGKK